ncbi:MAG: hypothetical protein WBX00_32055 [Isosphaeraceae bacterium]
MVISPYVVVPGTQPKVPVKFEYADESDPGPYPIPRDAPIEGGEKSQGDRHVLVIDRDHGRLYELLPRQPRSAHILAADSVRQQPIAAPEESEINHGIHRNTRKRESESTSPFRVLPFY